MERTQKRNDLIDIMRGMLILLVVLGHTDTPFTAWIYSFHMAAFFAISGYLWQEKYTDSRQNVLRYIKSRILRLYIPFVAINIVYILLNNIFIKLGFYTTQDTFLEITRNWPIEQVVSTKFSLKYMAIACAKSFLLLGGSARMVNVSWFLSTLFIVSIGHMLVSLLTKHFSDRIKTIVYAVSLFACLTLAYLGSKSYVVLNGGVQRLFPAYAAYILGVLARKNQSALIKPAVKWPLFGCAATGFAMVIAVPRLVELSKGYIVDPLYFILGMLQGITVVFLLSKLAENTKIGMAFKCLGKRSMSIMLLHFTAFKLVTLLIIAVYKKPMVYLASFPVIYDVSQFWSVLYLAVGVGLPLAAGIGISHAKKALSTITKKRE